MKRYEFLVKFFDGYTMRADVEAASVDEAMQMVATPGEGDVESVVWLATVDLAPQVFLAW